MRERDRQKKKIVISFPSPSSLLPTENNMAAEELNLVHMLNFASTADYGFICLVACFSFEFNTACQMW